jgi:hypothetical protein
MKLATLNKDLVHRHGCFLPPIDQIDFEIMPIILQDFPWPF